MGDLIQRLPTDEIQLPNEEQENFALLFGVEEQEPPPRRRQQQQFIEDMPPPSQTARMGRKNTRHLKREFISVFSFIIVFFILNLPVVKSLIQGYIPLCNKSWIATNVVQSILFGFVMWMVVNFDYSRS